MIDIVQEYIIEQFDNIVYSLDFGMEELNELNLEWIDFLESVDWNKNYVVLERTIEGYFPNDSMELLHEEIRKHKYPANKIIFLTSDLKIEKNYNNWKLKSKFKDEVLKIYDILANFGCKSRTVVGVRG